MKITNKLGLPDALVRAVKSYSHTGYYSASMLTRSPRMVWLARRHYNEMEEDVTDRIWALFGTAVHAVLNEASTDNTLTEEYLKHEFEEGFFVSGIADLYHNGKISDWKTASVWSLIYLDDAKMFEYEVQLNTYAFLYRNAGFSVTDLEIVMILRDWQGSKAKYDSNYPQAQVAIFPVKLWGVLETEKFIRETIQNFEKYKDVPDDDLPYCTEKDRWVKPSKWALMKTGRKSAIKLYDEKPDIELETGQYWEERKAEQWKRCEYCSAKNFCCQWKDGNE